MNAAEIDRLLVEPAIVFGSLPPEGRDLDLLVSPGEKRRLQKVLTDAGWLQRGRTFARFAGGTAFAVDLVVLGEWSPTPAAITRLQEEAEPLPGYLHICAPAGHHRLLILARRFGAGMKLDERKLSRIAAFSKEDWSKASAEASIWGLGEALRSLEVALSAAPERGKPLALRSLLHRKRGRLISLSGLDGSGKSTQGEALRAALEALGFEVRIEWTKVARDPVLSAVARPVKAVLGRFSKGGPAAREEPDEGDEERNYPDGPPPPPDAGKLLRQKNPLLTWGWTIVVAWANGRTHRKTVLRHLRAGRVVICDRYVLDSLTHLRYRYGPACRFRLQGAIIHLLSPKPACAFLLDVSPETARARKPEQYTTAELKVLRGLYREEAARLEVVSFDPERPLEELAAEIAITAWSRLTNDDR